MKGIVGVLTMSAAMLAEAYHSFADTFNQIILALGIRNSMKAPDLEHPFGYQKNQFFWSFVVAVLIFGISGSLAFTEGFKIVLNPDDHHINRDLFGWNILVLGIAIVLEFIAFRTAFAEAKDYKEKMGTDSIIEALDEMQDPVLLSLLTEDTLALIGLIVALVGVVITIITNNPLIDGFTSLLIGLILMIGGLLLARENKTYLIGKAVTKRIQEVIKNTIEGHPGIVSLTSMKTMLLGPKDYIVALDVVFEEGDDAKFTDSLEKALIKAVPDLEAGKIFIESQLGPKKV